MTSSHSIQILFPAFSLITKDSVCHSQCSLCKSTSALEVHAAVSAHGTILFSHNGGNFYRCLVMFLCEQYHLSEMSTELDWFKRIK